MRFFMFTFALKRPSFPYEIEVNFLIKNPNRQAERDTSSY